MTSRFPSFLASCAAQQQHTNRIQSNPPNGMPCCALGALGALGAPGAFPRSQWFGWPETHDRALQDPFARGSLGAG